jgi:putative transposase
MPHGRRSIRLKGYDYASPGYYFVTICTHQREHLFGNIRNGIMCVNELGGIVYAYARDMPNHAPHAHVDTIIVMPDHVHMIIVIIRPRDRRGATCGAPTITDDTITDDTITNDTITDDTILHDPGWYFSYISDKPGTLGRIIGGFKSACTTHIQARYGYVGKI